MAKANAMIMLVLFSSGFTPLRFATVDQRYEKVPYISDHYPIAAVLEFK